MRNVAGGLTHSSHDSSSLVALRTIDGLLAPPLLIMSIVAASSSGAFFFFDAAAVGAFEGPSGLALLRERRRFFQFPAPSAVT